MYRYFRNAFYFLKGFDADRFSAPVYRIKNSDDLIRLQEVSEQKKVNFIIPIEKCIWGAGFRYTVNTHPFAKAMQSSAPFDVLKSFYNNYTPDNIFELFMTENSNKMQANKNLVMPWLNSPSTTNKTGEGGIPVEEGVQHYGPCTDRKVSFEANRCKIIFKKIKQEGFWPQRYAGYPRGYFLVSGNNFLFQITGSGQHRTAALAVLGWEQIQCTSWNQPIRIVNKEDAENWPGVRDKRLSKKNALELFERNFSDDLRNHHSELLKTL